VVIRITTFFTKHQIFHLFFFS
jgi:hypothetical protein